MMSIPRLYETLTGLLVLVMALLVNSTAVSQAEVCTLADRIQAANSNTAVGFCPAGTSHDVITITEDIKLSEALPPITGTITIEGGGHAISGAGQFRIFDVRGGNLTVNNLTLRDGRADKGGAIRIDGGSEVVISRSTLSNNSAVYGGALTMTGDHRNQLTVVESSFLNNRADWHAGALELVRGRVSVSGSSFRDNYSDDYGGAITNAASRTRIENSTFANNSAKHDSGVLHVFGGDVSLIHVTMVNNFLTNPYGSAGSAISKQAQSPADSKLSLRNSIIVGRGSGAECAGGLDAQSGNLSRDGACAYRRSGDPLLGKLTGSPAYFPPLDKSPAIDAADAAYCPPTDQIGNPRPQGAGCDIGAIESRAEAALATAVPEICPLHDQIIAANTDRAVGNCPAGNGADTIYMIRDYTLTEPLAAIRTDITIEGNGHTINGVRRHRIFDVDGGKLTVNNVTLLRGSGTGFGGAIRLRNGGRTIVNEVDFVENVSGKGGAIGSMFAASMTINSSRFIKNRANDGGAIGMNGGGFAKIANSSFVENSAGAGGAIHSFSGQLLISNSSFIGNKAGKGGGLWAGGASASGYVPVTLTHVTLYNNSAMAGAATFVDDSPSTKVALNLRNSALGGLRIESAPLCVGRLSQNLHNLIEDGSCSPMLSGDPLFEAAEESAAMIALSAGSPAIDAGYPELCLEADQIGTPRPLGLGCELGALEVMPAIAALSDCRVQPTHNLNFRDGPWGNIIGTASYATTFTAVARTPGWFQVEDAEQGRSGWISALYVRMAGDCG